MDWREPTFIGSAGKIGDLALEGRRNWHVVDASADRDLPLAAIRRVPNGISQVHHVNALDPGTVYDDGYCYPDDADPGAFVPAGRP